MQLEESKRKRIKVTRIAIPPCAEACGEVHSVVGVSVYSSLPGPVQVAFSSGFR